MYMFMNVYEVDMENNDDVVLMMMTIIIMMMIIKPCLCLCRTYVHCTVGCK